MNFPALGPKPVRPHVISRFPSSEESKLSQAGCPRGRVGTRAVLGERKRPPHATGDAPPCALSTWVSPLSCDSSLSVEAGGLVLAVTG